MKLLKRKILAAASTGVLLCMGAAPSMAYEAPSLSFHPVASWDVSDMVHPQTGDKHCLMVNEYNNGFIMQFQASKGNIESLSIDLRQSAFQKGQSKKVTATLPGKTSVSLPAKAFNSDTIAINMAGQNSFFQAMKSASALDIKIDNNAFRFFTTGFANAARSFESCMNPAVAARPVAEAAPTPMNAPTAEDITEDNAKISLSEPVRNAPSKLMHDRSAQAQEKYAEELSVMLQEPKEKVSAELQKAMKDQQGLMADDALNKKPEPVSSERYTDKLAEEMGTAKEVDALKPVASADMAVQEDVVELPNTAASPDKEEIAWNGPAVSKKIDIQEPAAKTAAMADMPEPDPEEKNLIEELQDWVKGDEPEDPVQKQAAVDAEERPEETAPPKQQEPADVKQALQDEGILPMDKAPVTHSYKTPEMKVNKEVIKHEADFTGSGLPVREVGMPQAKEPFSDSYASSKRAERLENQVQRLKRENSALNSELETALRAGEKERLEISSDNWNLEQATMRYNEAERQLAKLGQQIQKERAECAYEKKELEMMLFDPQVTEEAQLARLSSLEKKIKKLQAELDAAKGVSQ